MRGNTIELNKMIAGSEGKKFKTAILIFLHHKTFPKRLALKVYVCYNYNDKVCKHNRKGRDT